MKDATTDLRKVAAHVLMHRTKPQAEPMKGNDIQWAYIRTMDRILRGDVIECVPDKKVPG